MKQLKLMTPALMLSLGVAALAQPAAQQGNAQNPPNQQPGGFGGPGFGGPGGRGGRGGFDGPGGGPGGMQMTPEQRQQMMAQMREQNLRFQLIQANIDQAAQNAIAQYDKRQSAAAQKMQALMQQLTIAVSTPNTPDAKIAELLGQIENAVAAEKERRQKDEAALDAQISYSQNPRLSALLTTMGLIGEAALLSNSSNTNRGFGGPGFGGPGFGGPGGRDGGRGGRGGFGGPGGPGGQ